MQVASAPGRVGEHGRGHQAVEGGLRHLPLDLRAGTHRYESEPFRVLFEKGGLSVESSWPKRMSVFAPAKYGALLSIPRRRQIDVDHPCPMRPKRVRNHDKALTSASLHPRIPTPLSLVSPMSPFRTRPFQS